MSSVKFHPHTQKRVPPDRLYRFGVTLTIAAARLEPEDIDELEVEF
jgi:hypothetical protein